MSRVEVGRLRGEEQKRAGEVFRLAQPALRHAGEEALADVRRVVVFLEHPGGQRRAEDRRRDGVDGDAGGAELAAQCLGDAVDRGFRGAVGGVAGRMAEQAAGRGHQHDLAAVAPALDILGQHLPGGGARHQPGLRDVGIHHVEEAGRRHVGDLGHIVLAGGDDEDVDPAEAGDGVGDDALAGRLVRRTRIDRQNLRIAAGGRRPGKCRGVAGDQRELRACAGQHLRGDRAEGAGRAGDDRHLAGDVEQGERIGERVHDLASG